MEKLKKVFFATTLLVMALAMVGTFTSCSDDEQETEVAYTYGFSRMSSSSARIMLELGEIEDAFKSALNVSGSPFKMSGTVSSCDTKVKAACEKAYEKLLGKIWNGNYTFVVTNAITGTTVYTGEIKKNTNRYHRK